MKSPLQPGMQVLIIEDCREGHPATGQIAIFETSFSLMGCSIPHFRLPDGSEITGLECWWRRVEEALPLAEAQKALEEHKAILREMVKEKLEEGVNHEAEKEADRDEEEESPAGASLCFDRDYMLARSVILALEWILNKQNFECDCEPHHEWDTNATIHSDNCALSMIDHTEAVLDNMRKYREATR